MKTLLSCLLALALLPTILFSRPATENRGPRLATKRLVAGPIGPAAKADGDTLLLLGPHGSGAPAIGTFETAAGMPAWNGWSSVDDTQDYDLAWHASTFHAVNGTYSAWCGDPDILSCNPIYDDDGGYGNNYREFLEWRGTVADKTLPCTVTVSAVANLDTEPGYDYCYVSCEKRNQVFVDLWSDFGQHTAIAIGGATVYNPEDYVGENGDEVRVIFRFHSDGAFSAEDCLWPNDGAIQLDDVVIALDNGTGYSHDFEDGTLGEFAVVTPRGVGDFTQLWTGLQDLDPCADNLSAQVAFIDDGQVVPGTGGSACLTWCYGPGGYVVNSTGGVADNWFPYWTTPRDMHLNNAVISPPLVWLDTTHDGAELSFDVYRHEELIPDASAGMFYVWSVRSVATGDPADLERARWRDRRTVYFGGPQYYREHQLLDDLLEPGCTHVQVRLGVWEYGWYGGWDGSDASPAPYFDNVRLKTYRATGPALAAEARSLATDAFPASGVVDLVNLGANSVAFAPALTHDPNGGYPPDSLRVTCVPVGAGAILTEPPQFHYKLRRNPLFDPWRTAGLPDEDTLACIPSYADGEWAIDLPDEGFLFPGDRLHCFFSASEDAGAGPTTVLLPADTAGFASFADFPAIDGGYAPQFAIRALPTIRESATTPGTYEANSILFYHDSGADADWAVWSRALHESGLLGRGLVDVFHTRDALARLDVGLADHATAVQLGSYSTVVYTSGEMITGTLDDGLYEGRVVSRDAQLLDDWLRLGGRNLLAFGDELASSLARGTAFQATFLDDWFGCTVDGRDVRRLIDNQSSPVVSADVGNPVLDSVSSWVAYGGGCSSDPVWDGYATVVPSRFDAVTAGAGAVRLASWTPPVSSAGTYPQAAALLHEVPAYTAKVVLVPVDFPLIRNDPQEAGGASVSPAARNRLLMDVLNYFGQSTPGAVTPVPDAAFFAVRQHPNPFNPATTIAYTAPHSGRLTIKVYDVRGQLVRTLWDAPVAGDGVVVWDGTGTDGAVAPSGVYFYEARLGQDVRVGKMALVK